MQRKNSHIIDHLPEHALTIPESTAFIVLKNGEAIEQKLTYKVLAERFRERASLLTAQHFNR